jgi:hypothetical protein
MIFSCGQQPVLLHFTDFLGKSSTLYMQIVGQLLPVKGNIEFVRSGLQ